MQFNIVILSTVLYLRKIRGNAETDDAISKEGVLNLKQNNEYYSYKLDKIYRMNNWEKTARLLVKSSDN